MEPTVSDYGEKRLIAEVVGPAFPAPRGVIGVGDDAAVLDIPNGHSVVVSTDKIPEDLLAIELGLMTAAEHGRYLAAVNVSDIVAMAAVPMALLLTTSVPGSFPLRYYREFISGFARGGVEFGAPVVGGDTGASSAPFFSATAIGSVPRGVALTRSTVGVGDSIAVTGDVGGFGAALSYYMVAKPLGRVLKSGLESALLDRLVRPEPRTDLIPWLQSGHVRACMDITDGLGQSLTEFASASSCGLRIAQDQVPLHPGVLPVADLLDVDPFSIAFGIGLDLELLVAFSDETLEASQAHVIGEAVAGEGVRAADTGDSLPGRRWEHFAAEAQNMVAGYIDPQR
jgi:thiamine-monophosphate kinase